MSDTSLRSINLTRLTIGLCLMLASICLYRFYDVGVFVAVPLFCIGSALAGATVLSSNRGSFARLALGWSLLALSVLPIVLVVLFFNNWVGP